MSRFLGQPKDSTFKRQRDTELPGPLIALSASKISSGSSVRTILSAIPSLAGVELYHREIHADEYVLYYAIGTTGNRVEIARSTTPWLKSTEDPSFLHENPPFGQIVAYTLDVIIAENEPQTVGEVIIDLGAYQLPTPAFITEACTLNMDLVNLEWTWGGDHAELESFEIEREATVGVWVQIATVVALSWTGTISSAQSSENFRIKASSTRLWPSGYDTIGLTDGANTGGVPADNRGDIDHRDWTKNLTRNASFELIPDLVLWATSNATIDNDAGATWKDRENFVAIDVGGFIRQSILMPQTSSDLISFSIKCGLIGTGTFKILDQNDVELASVALIASSTVVLENLRIPPDIWEIKILVSSTVGTCEIDAIQCNQGATVDTFNLHTHDQVSDVYGVLSDQGSAILQNEGNITLIVGDLEIDNLNDALTAHYSFLRLTADEFLLSNTAIQTNADDIDSANVQIQGLTDIVDGTDSSPGTIWAQLNLNTSAISQNETDIISAVAAIVVNSNIITDPSTGNAALSSSIGLNTQAIIANDGEITGLDGRLGTAEASITLHSTALDDGTGSPIDLSSEIVLRAQVTNGETTSIASIALGASSGSGTDVTISADNINMIGVVTILNDPNEPTTLIDGGKIFAGETVTVGEGNPTTGQFIIDGVLGQIRTSDNRFKIHPGGTIPFFLGSGANETYLSSTGDWHTVYRGDLSGGNFLDIETENLGFIRHWVGDSPSIKKIRGERAKDRTTFYSGDSFSDAADRVEMNLTTTQLLFSDPNEAGAITRVLLNSSGLNFYNSSGTLTGSYPSTGITGGSLAGLSDTTITGTPSDEQFLRWNSGVSKWVNETVILGSPDLENLTDTSIPATPSDNDVLTWSTVLGKWAAEAPSGGGSTTLDGLTDTDLSSPANDQVLTYNSTTSKWENQASQSGGVTTLAGLNDTTISSPADEQLLLYNSSTSKWINWTPSFNLDVIIEMNIGSEIDEDVLMWNNSSSKWENQQLPTSHTISSETVGSTTPSWSYFALNGFWRWRDTISLSNPGVVILDRYAGVDDNGRFKYAVANESGTGNDYWISWFVHDATGGTNPGSDPSFSYKIIEEN